MLGRLRSNDISFPDDGSLSKQHLAFEREGEGWVVVDLGSRNGTFVNGARVLDRRRLELGDIVRAGKVVVTFGVNPEDTVVFGGPEHLVGLPNTVRATLESALQSHEVAGRMDRRGELPVDVYGAATLDDAEQYQAKQRGEDAELNGRGATRIARKSGAEQHRRGGYPAHPAQLGCGAHQL